MAEIPEEARATNALAVFNKETSQKVGFSEIIDGSWSTIFRVEPDTEYAKGDFYCAVLKYNDELGKNEIISDIIDIPAFKTEPKTTTTTTTKATTTTTVKPTTTTTSTSSTTTTTTTLNPSDPSDVPDAESEVPETGL